MSDVTDGKDEAVTKAIEAAIKKVNGKSESRAKTIAKFAILPQDFSIPGGELGKFICSIAYFNTIPTMQRCTVVTGCSLRPLSANRP